MKESIYNYYVQHGDKCIFFNGLSKRFFTSSLRTQPMFEAILHNPDNYVEKYGKFIEKVKKDGFILEDEQDEYQLAMDNYKKDTLPNTYKLMILPTYACNLSCWYCLQDHRSIHMSEETVKKAKLHIKKYLISNKIKYFYLTWFGGEPLLKYDIVVDISSYSKELCSELGIVFHNSITTNSLLLNKERISKLNDCGVDAYQITLDGSREEHNKVKSLPKKDTFLMALNNIVDILTISKEAYVILRINYSERMNNPRRIIDEISEIIPESLRNRIKLDIQKVWQEGANLRKDTGYIDLATYAGKCHFRPEVFHHGKCYVDNRHFNTILPNGTIDICDHEGLDIVGRAELTKNGDIKWQEQLPCFKYSIINENIKCNKCKHMPICGGPCPAKRNSIYKDGNVNAFPCLYSDMDEEMNQNIKNLHDAVLSFRNITKE
ncbi:MAG: radical SAM protein [Prevotella sp.]|nr:radical SAM protein [Prevotella sp.]